MSGIYFDYDFILRGIFVFLLVIFLLWILFRLVMYILRAIGLYAISKRRELGTSAFGWIPILCLFKFGQIADDAVLNKKGSRPHFMVLFPVFSIAGTVVSSVGAFIGSLSFYIPNLNLETILKHPEEIEAMIPRISSRGGLIVGVVLLVLGILLGAVAEVMQYICCFHIYRSLSTRYIVMFILSFLFPFLICIFLFATRKSVNPVWYVPGRKTASSWDSQEDTFMEP